MRWRRGRGGNLCNSTRPSADTCPAHHPREDTARLPPPAAEGVRWTILNALRSFLPALLHPCHRPSCLPSILPSLIHSFIDFRVLYLPIFLPCFLTYIPFYFYFSPAYYCLFVGFHSSTSPFLSSFIFYIIQFVCFCALPLFSLLSSLLSFLPYSSSP